MPTPDPGIAQLAGSWRLLSHGTTFTDTKERLEIFGQKPDGRMVLTHLIHEHSRDSLADVV